MKSLVAAFVVSLSAGMAPAKPSEAKMATSDQKPKPIYVLEITGSQPDVSFSGECRVRKRDGGMERIALDGTVPLKRELTGFGVTCDIRQASKVGSLTVDVSRKGGGNRTRSRTRGPGSRILIQTR